MNRLITVLGPTAVGKTDLTLQLAQQLNSPVISGDAYQVYRGLNIGSAKPTSEELSLVPHYLIDILDPQERYSTALFQEAAQDLIREFNQARQIPILSGGTGLYVQSLLENYQFSKNEPNFVLRNTLDRIYEESGLAGLRAYALDKAKAIGIPLHVTDKHRLYRAIELMEAGDYEGLVRQTKDGLSYEGPVIGLMRNRENLYERINFRVDCMVEKGLFREVEGLLAAGVPKDAQSFKGIGYKEVIAYLDGDMTKDACIDSIKQNTRRFAKRQITWYKRMPYIQWIHIEEGMTQEDIFELAWPLVKDIRI